jgi:hypothetical protein
LFFLTDKKILLGIGIGIIISTIIMLTNQTIYTMSKSSIESQAYSYGMRYPADMKVK